MFTRSSSSFLLKHIKQDFLFFSEPLHRRYKVDFCRHRLSLLSVDSIAQCSTPIHIP